MSSRRRARRAALRGHGPAAHRTATGGGDHDPAGATVGELRRLLRAGRALPGDAALPEDQRYVLRAVRALADPDGACRAGDAKLAWVSEFLRWGDQVVAAPDRAAAVAALPDWLRATHETLAALDPAAGADAVQRCARELPGDDPGLAVVAVNMLAALGLLGDVGEAVGHAAAG
jgi:hypothetical protein